MGGSGQSAVSLLPGDAEGVGRQWEGVVSRQCLWCRGMQRELVGSGRERSVGSVSVAGVCRGSGQAAGGRRPAARADQSIVPSRAV